MYKHNVKDSFQKMLLVPQLHEMFNGIMMQLSREPALLSVMIAAQIKRINTSE